MPPILHPDDSLLTKLLQGKIASDDLIALLNQYGMLPPLVRELLIDQAIAPIALSPEETLRACQQFYQQHQINSETDLQTWLDDRGLSRDQLDALATRTVKLEQFKQNTWGHKLESYFLQRKAYLDRVIYSLIRITDMGIAQELYFRIQEGEQPLTELAREHSQGPEAQTGGLLGPVELSVPHPALAKILSASQPGQLMPPTRLGDWIVIVRLEKFLPAQLDNAMRQRLLNELFEEWVRERQKAEGKREKAEGMRDEG
jgi:parvulin-like peptidyl-prolyl isomerase